MNMWQKIKSIRIPGSIVAASLTGTILGTTMVLFILLPISPTKENILVENTCGSLELQKVKKEK